MPISTAQTQTDTPAKETQLNHKKNNNEHHAHGLVLIEMLVVLGMLALITSIASISLTRGFARSQFKKEAQALVKTLTMAYNASTETDRRYAVTIYLDEDPQSYMLREYKTLDELAEFTEQNEILKSADFTNDCWLEYVYFDDGTDSRDPDFVEPILLFICGRNGWQNGGKIALQDHNGAQYTIVVNRMLGVVTLVEGDVEILIPRYKEDVPF